MCTLDSCVSSILYEGVNPVTIRVLYCTPCLPGVHRPASWFIFDYLKRLRSSFLHEVRALQGYKSDKSLIFEKS